MRGQSLEYEYGYAVDNEGLALLLRAVLHDGADTSTIVRLIQIR